jgi:hypothetical protein
MEYIVWYYGTEFQREDSDIDFAILFDKDINLHKAYIALLFMTILPWVVLHINAKEPYYQDVYLTNK